MADVSPVLMVIADQQDFWYQDYEDARAEDGAPDSVWLDLDFPQDAGQTAQSDLSFIAERAGRNGAADADPLPVLMVIADQQDFYH